jgi:O-antigen/teichoic acid export membrane protein
MSSRPHSFTADVLKLVTGTTLAQIIVVLASPLLTRLYGPEAFGFFALFTSITSIILVVKL